MTENRIVESGTFGPVFSTGVCPPDSKVYVNEGIIEFLLRREDAFLMVEMTVEAAATLADLLTNAVANELRAPR